MDRPWGPGYNPPREARVGIIVQKFGGSSVADVACIERVADLVVATRRAGSDVVVVVSAMGGTTDQLLKLAHEINPSPSTRELDMLLTVGERTTTALMAMAIQKRGVDAVSLTGSQCGIMTNASHSHARIIEIRPFRLLDELDAGRVVVVAGYQGTSYKREITTLGRGGSDTTAVALAAALNAERCEIWSDIEAVFTADPKVVLDAKKLMEVTYQEMLDLSRHGAKVLNAEAVDFARRAGIAIYTRSTFRPDLPGTVIRANPPPEPRAATGIASRKGLVAVEIEDGEPAAAAMDLLARSDLVPDLVAAGGSGGAVLVFAEGANVHLAASLETALNGRRARVTKGLATVTVVGDVAAHDDLRGRCLPCLNALGCVTGLVATPTAVTALVPAARVDEAVAALHAACMDGDGARA
jgi:aspartate kinase